MITFLLGLGIGTLLGYIGVILIVGTSAVLILDFFR